MLRSIISAVALATVLATVHPAFADPLAAKASDQTQPAAAATQQQTPPAAALSRPSGVTAPATSKDFSPVGFGWG
jgi:hypothetical protein